MNIVTLSGKVIDSPEINNSTLDEQIYYCYVGCERLSGAKDVVKVLIPGKLKAHQRISAGDEIRIVGQMRSRNYEDEQGTHCETFLWAETVNFDADCKNENMVEFEGKLCNTPKVRHTQSNREVATFILAIKRRTKNADFIPCIAWGRDASYISSFNKGENVSLVGRIQSRSFEKDCKTYHIHEVSARNLIVKGD